MTSLMAPDSRRTLVVVGSGFIAAELARTAKRAWGWKVEVFFRNYRNPALEGITCHRLPATIDELVGLLHRIQPTDIVIAMGSSFVPEINRDVDKALEQHLNGTLMILDALARLECRLAGRVLVVGSASEYGEFPEHAVDERHPALPRDHYGLIKLALRHLGEHFYRAHGLPVIHVRQFNVTGPEQDTRFVLPSICRQIALGASAAQASEVVRILAGNTSVRRDFLSISDVCSAYRTLMLHGLPGEVYNVCSGQAYRISDLIALAAEIAGIRAEVEVSSTLLRESDKAQAVIWGDPAKLRAIGWTPRAPMQDLLTQMLSKYTLQADGAPSRSSTTVR